MKDSVKTRNLIIITLCLTIICMGVGFAILSMKLEEFHNNKPKFAVEFTKASPRTPVMGGEKTPTVLSNIINSNQTINMEFNLYSPYDEIGYKVTIKNTGNIPAEIVNLIAKPDYQTDILAANSIFPIKITHNDITGRILRPGEEIDLNIVAVFDYNSLPKDMKVSYQLSLITKTSNIS